MLGESIPRYDGERHVTGTTVYVDDVRYPGMLHVRPLVSPHANARILEMRLDKAAALPGVHLILTAEDIPRNRFGGAGDHHLFADGFVRYAGQLVAAVVAEDAVTAQQGADLIEVDYEVLPSVFDCLEAMKEGAPQVREHGNIFKLSPTGQRKIRIGDVESGFAEADYIFEDSFVTPVQSHAFLETHVGVAAFDERSRLLVHSTGQSIHWIHSSLAEVLDLPMEKIRVVGGIVGGGFGGKSDVSVEPVIALAALKTGRPVKWRWTFEEELRLPTNRGGFHLYYKTGVKKDGTITARSVKSIQDIGAFCYRGNRSLDRQGTVAGGPYRLPNYWFDGWAVHTNKVPAAALRGFAVPMVSFACEGHMDRIASELGLDPLEFRYKNALRENDPGFRGQPVDDRVSVIECLKAAEPSFRADPPVRRPGKNLRRGRGLALGVMPIGLTAGTAPVAVNAYLALDGLLTLAVNTSDLGQGARTVFTQLAAQILEIEESRISATLADSSLYPACAGSGASQVTYLTGNAIVRAVEKIRNRALEVAAQKWGLETTELTYREGQVLGPGPDQCLDLSQIAVEADRQGRGMNTTGVYQARTWLPDEEKGLGKPYEEYNYAACWAEVEVDTETGRVTVKRLVSAVDVGQAINPMAVEGQIEGGAIMNLGYALTEDLYPPFQGGRNAASGLHEYLIPTIMDVPMVEPIIVEKPSRKGPLGAKGLGEVTATMIAPAIANAVAEATGIFPDRLPISPERMLGLLKKRNQGEEP